VSAGARASAVQVHEISGFQGGLGDAEPSVIMDILTWLIVGLCAGVLASLVVGTGFGILGDIVVGIAGAFIGGWLFAHFGWRAPFGGIAGVISVAFIGSVVLLLLITLIRRAAWGP
jgi:uncharacterized membrane protein YeaQ/YmgE (transglycosylase-associated protein family)